MDHSASTERCHRLQVAGPNHPAVLLKIYIYGYLNRAQSSRRLERECQRHAELMWLTGRLALDFKTIADFRRDNGTGIGNVSRRFVVLCREPKLFSQPLVAIDGSKFKAVNTRDRNLTEGKVDKRQRQIEESIQTYLNALEPADRTQPAELEAKTSRLQDKIARLREQMRNLEQIKEELKAQPDGQLSMTDPDARSMAKSGVHELPNALVDARAACIEIISAFPHGLGREYAFAGDETSHSRPQRSEWQESNLL